MKRGEEMSFTTSAKETALAIVRIFETGSAAGDFGAVAVLNDYAGVSYGISQFTHRSGALAAVVTRYLENGGVVGREILIARKRLLQSATVVAITKLAKDEQFKKALRAAAVTSEMKAAQTSIAEEVLLRPAIEECHRLGFVTPLSLAVALDSITHGSWE
jgi:hypothetical protein